MTTGYKIMKSILQIGAILMFFTVLRSIHAQSETSTPVSQVVTAFEWMGEDHLILSYADGWVRDLSLEDHTLQDIAQYPNYEIILAVSPDKRFLAIGNGFMIDIYERSEGTEFSRSSSVHIFYYTIDAMSWHWDTIRGLPSVVPMHSSHGITALFRSIPRRLTANSHVACRRYGILSERNTQLSHLLQAKSRFQSLIVKIKKSSPFLAKTADM